MWYNLLYQKNDKKGGFINDLDKNLLINRAMGDVNWQFYYPKLYVYAAYYIICWLIFRTYCIRYVQAKSEECIFLLHCQCSHYFVCTI